jgi:hypothetical protein
MHMHTHTRSYTDPRTHNILRRPHTCHVIADADWFFPAEEGELDALATSVDEMNKSNFEKKQRAAGAAVKPVPSPGSDAVTAGGPVQGDSDSARKDGVAASEDPYGSEDGEDGGGNTSPSKPPPRPVSMATEVDKNAPLPPLPEEAGSSPALTRPTRPAAAAAEGSSAASRPARPVSVRQGPAPVAPPRPTAPKP